MNRNSNSNTAGLIGALRGIDKANVRYLDIYPFIQINANEAFGAVCRASPARSGSPPWNDGQAFPNKSACSSDTQTWWQVSGGTVRRRRLGI